MEIYPNMSTNAININGLSSSLERHRLSDWMQRNNSKRNPPLGASEDTHLEQKVGSITNKWQEKKEERERDNWEPTD